MIGALRGPLLLLAALVPAVLSGQGLHHCHQSGTQGFWCGCCGDAEEPADAANAPARSCCARHDTDAATSSEDGESPRGNDAAVANPSVCTCCDVTTLEFPSPDPRETRPELDAHSTLTLVAALASIDPLLPRPEGTARPPERSPPTAVHPSIRILHSSLLI